MQTHMPVGERHIEINVIHNQLQDQIKNDTQMFLHNQVTSGKYNAINFIPFFLSEQFLHKYSNLVGRF
jgi:Phospholipid-translocating ATPase N-terminal